MGTRADFYVGRGADKAEWIGSVGMDGYPEGIPDKILGATDEASFRKKVAAFIADDGIEPIKWPWPWKDSRLTDYTYSFDSGTVYVGHFGGGLIPYSEYNPVGDLPERLPGEKYNAETVSV